MSTKKSTRVNRPVTPRSERTRAHLLDTALRLFTEQGYEEVRVEDIAREAGLSRAAFYKHFSERDEIIGELLDRLLAPTPGAPPAGTDAPEVDRDVGGGGHLDRVIHLLVRAAERMAAQEPLARFVYSLPVRPTRDRGRSRPAVFGGVVVLVEEAGRSGELRAGLEPDLVVDHLARTFEAGMRDWAEGKADRASDRVRLLLDVAVRGVGR